MLDQEARISSLVRDELKAKTLGNMGFGYAVGHGFGTVPGPDNQVYLGPLWVVTITMRNPLVGQPDIAHSLAIPGPLPPDKFFREVVQRLAEACAETHDRAIEIPQEVKK